MDKALFEQTQNDLNGVGQSLDIEVGKMMRVLDEQNNQSYASLFLLDELKDGIIYQSLVVFDRIKLKDQELNNHSVSLKVTPEELFDDILLMELAESINGTYQRLDSHQGNLLEVRNDHFFNQILDLGERLVEEVQLEHTAKTLKMLGQLNILGKGDCLG